MQQRLNFVRLLSLILPGQGRVNSSVSILKSTKSLLLQAAVAAESYGLFASSVSGISTHYRQFKPLGRL